MMVIVMMIFFDFLRRFACRGGVMIDWSVGDGPAGGRGETRGESRDRGHFPLIRSLDGTGAGFCVRGKDKFLEW